MIFALTATDKAGNQATSKISMYTEGYVFPNSYSFPLFTIGD